MNQIEIRNAEQILQMLSREKEENAQNEKAMRMICRNMHLLQDKLDALQVDRDLKAYIDQGYDIYFKNHVERRVRMAKVLRGILAGIISTAVLAAALQIIAYTFGYDIFKEIADWGKQILLLPDGITEEGDITINKLSTKMQKFNTIDELTEATGIHVLSPAYLPEGVVFDYIMYQKLPEETTIIYHTDDLSATIFASSHVDLPHSVDPVVIGEYECYIFHVDMYQADFVAENANGEAWQYTMIMHADYEELIKMIENLEYK